MLEEEGAQAGGSMTREASLGTSIVVNLSIYLMRF
jgi:hypothetical protein